ncbi:acid protease [Mollisia scopiformis]|uniref:Acid protease n=1 Tax=Mollisia scopiformis TaxID=149040 RepID=A0A132B738_MOLSC|nr:acid protease [Mollisia scopiformis]KUJ07694.1 acid protease [Mollisia scopiformis]
MKLYALLALAVAIPASNALVNRAPVPGVVSIPYSRSLSPLQRRNSFVDLSVGATYANYIVNITVGTPAQPITLSLDTGSSDTILLNKESSFCVTNAGYCPSVGYYNANKSSTYKYIASNFSSNFGFSSQGQGSGASGDVATDTFDVAGATLKNQQFDIAYGNATIAFSILGLSYASGENQYPYNNFPLSLAKSGAINLPLFSLWKNAVDSHDGQVLFGGVDTAQYTGSLLTLDTQTRTGFPAPVAFDVLLNGVALSGNSSFPAGSTGSVLHVLDCGTAYSILPNDWVQPIYDQFGVTYFTANDTAYVDCALANSPYTIDFTFGSLTIQVPIKVMVSLRSINPNICTFGIVPAGTRIALLGDNFLSSSYTVFDLSNNQISLAARNFDATTDSIIAVPSGGVKAISTSATGTTPSSTGTTTGTSATSTPTKKSSAPALSLSPATIGVAFIVVLFAFCF